MNLRIIPKIDIKNQNLVKGVHLEGLRSLGNPRKFIELYYASGADEIIYHDVVASLYERNTVSELLKETSKNIFLPMTVGGGINSLKEVEKILHAGADRVFINTAAMNNLNFLKECIKNFGSSTIVLSVEVVEENKNYFCRKDFGRESTDMDLETWLKKTSELGVGEFLITSIDRDGTGNGFDLEIAKKISKLNLSTPFILNGGFSKLEHFSEILKICKPSAFALGSMLHYNNNNKIKNEDTIDGNFDFKSKNISYKNFKKITISEIKSYLKKKFNLNIRDE